MQQECLQGKINTQEDKALVIGEHRRFLLWTSLTLAPIRTTVFIIQIPSPLSKNLGPTIYRIQKFSDFKRGTLYLYHRLQRACSWDTPSLPLTPGRVRRPGHREGWGGVSADLGACQAGALVQHHPRLRGGDSGFTVHVTQQWAQAALKGWPWVLQFTWAGKVLTIADLLAALSGLERVNSSWFLCASNHPDHRRKRRRLLRF